MNTDRDELRFQLKFNVHKMMPVPVEDGDIPRIAAILDCPQELLEAIDTEMRMNVRSLATRLKKSLSKKAASLRRRGRRVLCIGDSITSDRESYQKILAEAFRDAANVTFIDAAVSGDTTKDLRDRLYNTILCHSFETATIFIGTNDARMFSDGTLLPLTGISDYERNLDCLIGLLRNKRTDIHLITLPYADNHLLRKSFGDRKFYYLAEHIDAMNCIIRKTAATADCGLIDLARELTGEKNCLEPDGLHINSSAQMKLARLVLSAL